MLRIVFSVLGLAWLSSISSTASADFIEMPAPSVGDEPASSVQAAVSPHVESASAQQLWRDSAHLEVGYYVAETGLVHKQYVRPSDAALDAGQTGHVAQLNMQAFEPSSGGGVAECLAGVFAVLWVAGFVMRRHLLQRVRERA